LSTSMNTLQELIPVGHRGTSLAALQHAAVSLGFHAHPVRVGFEQLASTTLPAIAHLAHDHYVVLYAVDSTGVVVGDPAAAVVTLAPEAFRGQWSGHVLLLTR
jgi:subfamily B ATP-binding cassette protein HlyB/CyaB